ncbi:cytochrome P450 [Streptomyces sp. NPDC001700]
MVEFADPLPVRVIGALLGVPEGDWERFAYRSGTLFRPERHNERETRTAQGDLGAYLGEHVGCKRSEPGDDLISQVIAITDATGRSLPDEILVRIARGVMVSGHETTSSAIGKLLLPVDVNRAPGMPRYLMEDVELGGEVIPKGSTTLSVIDAANRDERMFPDPDALDLGRSPTGTSTSARARTPAWARCWPAGGFERVPVGW